jgi:ketosteroid isomerase-like protein
MSQENVETVKALFAAFAARDSEAAVKVLDPSVEIRPAIVGGPEGVVYQGPDGMRQFWSDVDAAWAEFRITTEHFQELDGRVLVLGRAFARGRDSGITLDAPAAWIAGLRNRRIVDFRSFSNQDEALKAAGLSESAMSDSAPVCRAVSFPTRVRRHRKLDEWVWSLFPRLMPLSTRTILRLPLGSRLRYRLVNYWVRRGYEIVNRRDFELALGAQHPDVLIRYAPDPGGRIPPDLIGDYHGHDGFREAWSKWLDAFEDLRVEPEEVIDLGGERLLVGIRAVGRGTGSGIEVAQRGFTLYTFRDGMVASQEFFFDRQLAEEAAGISE